MISKNFSIPESSTSWLAWRAILALILMICFYGLAFSIAGVLLYIPYALTKAHVYFLVGKLFAFCVVGACVIIYSIFPRIERFIPPGPRLEPDKQPQLFAELFFVAKAMRQKMPEEVYLINEVNAGVSQRGGFMGFGRKRFMFIGLPLLQSITISQLRAIIVHEFGHYCAGDVKLGPWVYSTRATLERTLLQLEVNSKFLQVPFRWYAMMFFLITNAVSRHEEYAADRLSALIAGSEAAVAGLHNIHKGGLGFQIFWISEVAPLLESGFRPPLAEGFTRFLKSPKVSEAVSDALKKEMEECNTDSYDSHPSLKDRLAALQKLSNGNHPPFQDHVAAVKNLHLGSAPADDPLAIFLIENLPELEIQLLETMAGSEAVQALKPVGWDEIGEKAYLPIWEKLVSEQASALKGLTPDSLCEMSRYISAFEKHIKSPHDRALAPDEASSVAFRSVGAALTVALKKRGWTLSVPIGEAVYLKQGEEIIEPFNVLPGLISGDLPADAWKQKCAAIGISDINLCLLTSDGAEVKRQGQGLILKKKLI